MRPETLSANHLIFTTGTVASTVELVYPLTATIVEVVELTATIEVCT